MSPLVRFGYGSIVQSDSPANSIQFALSDEGREIERGRGSERKISFSIRKTESLHAMHNKPFFLSPPSYPSPLSFLTNSKFPDDDENPL